ncbi:hypothetical protein ABMA28_008280 [Loxostege sticticalis]|uniref:Uncharacterized protein n=1 Tax=Loxostege sticticalis TaxID=481309 RepID=A0ABD0SIV7_LOXSC
MPRPKLSEEERKERKRLAERKRRQKIRSDPVLREEYLRKERKRYIKKKAAGVVIPRSAMSVQKLRNLRKKNLVSALASYKKKRAILHDNTPPNETYDVEYAETSKIEPSDTSSVLSQAAPNDNIPITPLTRRSSRLESLKSNRRRCENLRIDALVGRSSNFQATSSPQQTPLGSPQLTPNISSIDSSSRPDSPASNSSIATLKFQRDLQQKFRRYQKSKHSQISVLQKKIAEVTRERNLYKKRSERLIQKGKDRVTRQRKQKQSAMDLKYKSDASNPKQTRIRQIVLKFFEEDENSSMCPGKKDTITRNGTQKQKRLMTDTIKNLHRKYLESGYPPISYVTFSRFKPFWVLQPKINMRNTCLCQKHENMDLLIESLKRNRIIKENSVTDIIKSVCCDIYNLECLQRKCTICKNRHVIYQEIDNSKKVVYWAWEKQKNSYTKNGIQKTSITVEKVRQQEDPLTLIKQFETNLKPFLNHCANIRNQTDAVKELKQNLTKNECLIHIDFSENYSAKYNSEIQSVHFGGSRKQLTLHTAVLYFNIDGHTTKTQCFCTVSKSLRHDAAAVWAHLIPILTEIENTVPLIQNLYIVSDSPSGQYRNKKIFYIISRLSDYIPSINKVIWNYCECGHGKGAPDGVGGLLKRTADRYVALQNDIPDIDAFVNALKSSIKGVKIELVEEYQVTEKDWLLPDNLKPFPGTLKVHQVVWTAESGSRLALRRLSCTNIECLNNAIECPHGNHLGFYDFSTKAQILTPLSPSFTCNKNTPKASMRNMRPVKLTDKLSLAPKPSTSTPKIIQPATVPQFDSKILENTPKASMRNMRPVKLTDKLSLAPKPSTSTPKIIQPATVPQFDNKKIKIANKFLNVIYLLRKK